MRTQIENLQGFDFQEFITGILFVVYGADNFTNLRPVRDGGCDGLITKEHTAIACYGPGNPTQSKWKKKVEEDYSHYVARWAPEYPEWRLYVNREPGPNHCALVQDLHGDSGATWGLGRICAFIEEQAFGRRMIIYKALGLPADLYARHFVQMLLTDLMSRRDDKIDVRYAQQAPDPTEKIRINFPEDRCDEMIQLMHVTLNQQMEVDEALRGFDTGDIGLLKTRIITDFGATSAPTLGERLLSLARTYGYKYNVDEDDGLHAYIQGLLFHVFSQCLIGKDPKVK